MKKIAVYAGTRNIYHDMVTSAKSLIINSDVEKIYFLTEDDVFPFTLPKIIECINVNNQKFFDLDGPNVKPRFTWMVLIRAALPLIFKDVDRILSLDSDIIIDKDISDLWDLPIDDYYLAMAKETAKSKETFYGNAGVMLMNCKKLRDDGMAQKIVDTLNTKYYPWNEQDCINELCQGYIYEMSSDYNDNDYTIRPNKRKVIHYAALQHWRQFDLVRKYRNISFADIRRT